MVQACLLGAYLLSPCSPTSADVAGVYAPYAYAIPASHLAAVRCLYWTRDGHGEAQQLTGCIGLPRRPGLYILAHETGHQVSLRNGGTLLNAFRARFWPAGVQRGTPPSRHARMSVDEDFAESYAYTLMGKLNGSPERRDWMLRELPGTRARVVPRGEPG